MHQLRQCMQQQQQQQQQEEEEQPHAGPHIVGSVQLLLAPAAALAPLLRQHWAQPEQAAADRLAVAQAAAARSCAYLRCANLGGEGGPAAGEGVGSQRCR